MSKNNDVPRISLADFIADEAEPWNIGKTQVSDDETPVKYEHDIRGGFEDVTIQLLATANAKLDLLIAIAFSISRRFGISREEVQKALKDTHDSIKVETIRVPVDGSEE